MVKFDEKIASLQSLSIVWKGIHSRSGTNSTGAEGLSLNYSRIVHCSCLDQMLAEMVLSQHQVLSSKTVRPHAPCGAQGMGHVIKHGLRFVQRHCTCNSMKRQDPT